MVILDLSELIPGNYLLRKINQIISFDFIYDLVAPYYHANGRPSVDPVSMFKMLVGGIPLRCQIGTPFGAGSLERF